MDCYALSERHACKLLDMDRSSYRYESRRDHNSLLREELIPLAWQKAHFGYRRLWALLVKRGYQVNVKRVYRLYRQEHLAVRRPKRKRLERAAPVPALLKATNQEGCWISSEMPWVSGRGFHILTVADRFTRECPALEVGISLGSRRVTRVLERVIAERGAPQTLRCGNGPQFTSRHFYGPSEPRGIRLVHIEPGSSVQNGYVESFYGRFREELTCFPKSLPGIIWKAPWRGQRGAIRMRKTKFTEEQMTDAVQRLEALAGSSPRGRLRETARTPTRRSPHIRDKWDTGGPARRATGECFEVLRSFEQGSASRRWPGNLPSPRSPVRSFRSVPGGSKVAVFV
jgi:putative transposase